MLYAGVLFRYPARAAPNLGPEAPERRATMPTLSWSLNAEVQNGPKIAVSQTLAIESYDKT